MIALGALLACPLLAFLLARPPRRREGLLLSVLLPLVALGAVTAYQAREASVAGRVWLNVNTSTAKQLSEFTGSPLRLAEGVVAARDEQRSGRFSNLAQIPSLSRRPRAETRDIEEAVKARDTKRLEALLKTDATRKPEPRVGGLNPALVPRWARARAADPKLTLARSPAPKLLKALGDPVSVERILQRRRMVPPPEDQDLSLAGISAVSREGLSLRDLEDTKRDLQLLVELLLGALLLAHLVLRWMAPRSDGYLLPAYGGLGCLSVLVLFGVSSPLTDPEAPVFGHLLQGPAYLRQGWAVLGALALMPLLAVVAARGSGRGRKGGFAEALERGSAGAFVWVGLAFSLLAANAMARAPLLGFLGLAGLAATLAFGYRTLTARPALLALMLATAAFFLARTQESGFSFLYIEGSKLALILFMASFCARHEDRLERRFTLIPAQDLMAAGLWYLGCLALVLSTGDLGFLLLLWLPAGLVASLALRRQGPFLAAAGLLVLGCTLVVALSPVLTERLEWRIAFPERWQMLRQPFDAPSDQMANALYRVSSAPSVLLGTGLGNGSRGEAASDLNDVALPFYFEQLGLAGVLAVVLLFSLVLWRLCRIGMTHPDPFARWVALTSAAVLGIQTVYMLGANSFLLPLTGLTLAPAASGAWSAAAFGVLVAVALAFSQSPRQALPGRSLRRMLTWSYAAFGVVAVLCLCQYLRLWNAGESLALRTYAGRGGGHGNVRLGSVLQGLDPGDLLVRRSSGSWAPTNLVRAAWSTSPEDESAGLEPEEAAQEQPSGHRLKQRRYLDGLEGEALAPLTGIRTVWGEAYGNERSLMELLTGIGSVSQEALPAEERHRRQGTALLRAWRGLHSPWGREPLLITPQPERLTVIRDLQSLCYSRLKRVVDRMDQTRPLAGGVPRQAVMAVVDPRNGEYLAVAQVPSYSPAQVSESFASLDSLLNSNPSPLTDNLHYSARAPGSVAKITTIASLLQQDRSWAGHRWWCVGGRRVQGLPVACMVKGGRPARHGYVAPRDIIKLSCNEGAAQAAVAAGSAALLGAYQRLGVQSVGDPSKPNLKVQERFKRYLPWVAYGQTLSMSVDEVIRSVCAIANGGHLVSPHWRTTSNAWSRDVWRPQVASSVASMMAAADERGGTAFPVWKGSKRFPSKTGTAEAGRSRTGQWENDAWFVTFGPWDGPQGAKPKVALALWVQGAETRIGSRPVGTGGMTAAEVGVPLILDRALSALGTGGP
ncbi:MAG TPA: penicillin-binding transpeptidase domain-containing protein [Armatimonadota bacterium]|jgi:cell division protein FtsW (lipid II flippase)